MEKRTLLPKNLNTRPVYFDDGYKNSPFYFNFIEVPEKLSLGKNSFKFSPNANYLNINISYDIEFVDSLGNVLYYEMPEYNMPTDLNCKLITLYLYNDTPPGNIYMYIVGSALVDNNGQRIPNDWIDIINFRYNDIFNFEHQFSNSSPLIYNEPPEIIIKERRTPYNRLSENVSASFNYVTMSGNYYFNQNSPVIELSSGSIFTNDMIGGTIIISSSLMEPNDFIYNVNQYTTHTTVITNLINDQVAVLETPYSSSVDRSIGTGTVNYQKSLVPCNIDIYYYEFPSILPTENYKSNICITAKYAEPLSGTVKKVRVSGKSRGGADNYELLGESPVVNTELLINSGSELDNDRKNVGYFLSATEYQNFWDFKNIQYGYDTTTLYNSINLQLQNSDPGQMLSNVNISCQKNSQYRIIFNYKCIPNTKCNIYISGSSFSAFNTELGKLVNTIDTLYSRLDVINYAIDVIADNNGTGKLIFELVSGEINIADISFKSLAVPGYSPSTFKVCVPINTKARNDTYTFKVDFVDDLNRTYTVLEDDISYNISGSNLYVEENDNLIVGSVALSKQLNSGIILSGEESMIHLHNYSGGGNGGFAFWSGSRMFSGSLQSGSGFYFETGPPFYHSLKMTVNGKIILISDSGGGDCCDEVAGLSASLENVSSSYSDFRSYAESEFLLINETISNLVSDPNKMAELLGLDPYSDCPPDGRDIYLTLSCDGAGNWLWSFVEK